jgi:hypothetical protein
MSSSAYKGPLRAWVAALGLLQRDGSGTRCLTPGIWQAQLASDRVSTIRDGMRVALCIQSTPALQALHMEVQFWFTSLRSLSQQLPQVTA